MGTTSHISNLSLTFRNAAFYTNSHTQKLHILKVSKSKVISN